MTTERKLLKEIQGILRTPVYPKYKVYFTTDTEGLHLYKREGTFSSPVKIKSFKTKKELILHLENWKSLL